MSLISCESEYQRQLKQAKDLVQEEMEIRASSDVVSDHTPAIHTMLVELKNDIAFHAHLSGNEELFFQELNGFKDQLLAEEQPSGDILISKFP